MMFRKIAALLGASLALMLSGCTMAVFNIIVPRSGYTVQRDLAYGSDPRQKLDVYVPDDLKAPAPVLVFFFGGSWQYGDKDQYLTVGQSFASKGVITVVVNYRLYPPNKFPSFLQDGALAFKYVHDHAAQFGGDPKRIFLSGHSAGGYIAAMLGANLKYIRDAGGDPAWIDGVIGIAGPYDFLPLTDPKLIELFGGDRVAATQPITFVDGKRAPMLLVAGTDDTTVSPKNVTRMAAKLQSFGSPVETKFYPGVGHIGIILSLAPGFRGNTTLREDMLAFIAAH
jgi:acetyl esterase/lipase